MKTRVQDEGLQFLAQSNLSISAADQGKGLVCSFNSPFKSQVYVPEENICDSFEHCSNQYGGDKGIDEKDCPHGYYCNETNTITNAITEKFIP